MRGPFTSIKDFINIQEECVFCNRKLKCVLSSFNSGPRSLPIFNYYIKDDKFQFDFKHTNATWQVNAQISIDTKYNQMTLHLIEPLQHELSTESVDHLIAQKVFEDIYPYVEIYCPNRKCKMKYTLYSDLFKFDRLDDNIFTFKIKPFFLYMETFEIDNLWIQNDWLVHSLNIYSKNKTGVLPIQYSEVLNLKEMGKDKIITRIKTLVTYS